MVWPGVIDFGLGSERQSCWSLRCALRGEAGGSLKSGLKGDVMSGMVDSVVSEVREMRKGH